MKTQFRLLPSVCLAVLVGSGLSARAEPVALRYEVKFKDAVVATQTVELVQSAGLKTVSTAFAADLPVFVARHPYAEQLSASFRPDGTVERLAARIQDGPKLTLVSGALHSNGAVRIVRTDMAGTATALVARADYDFHSLVLYGTAPADFLPTNRPVRVLDVAAGRVVPVSIQTNAESETTPERQHVASMHLVWTEGARTSHSWHPETYGNLPRRYIRLTESGEFTFTLQR